MKSLDEIRQIKRTAEADLLKRAGVTGVDVGYKYVGGKRTDELSIRVLVEKKKDVPAKERLPATVKGVKTDVIQRTFVLHPRAVPVAELEPKVDAGTYDPLRGGISIGPCRVVGSCVFVGTLGVVVSDNASGDPMMLSNWHVMCVDNNWSVGDTIAQPGRVDGGNCPADVVGSLQRASLGGQVDCAVATITARAHACEIVDIGAVNGTAAATLGMAVRKRGRTTGLTFGTVDSIDLTVSVPYDDPAGCGITGVGTVTFTDQIGIQVDSTQSAQFGNGGDSGSVVVDDARQVVGLYFAGSPDGTFGVANPIQSVLSALNVSICTLKVKEKEFKDRLPKEFKERLPKELKELKEKDVKERLPKELKELKEKDVKERLPKELKEKDIKDKEIWEGVKDKEVWEGIKYREVGGDFPGPGPGPGGPLEDRVARLEDAVVQLTHFIGPELRPDLSTAALSREPDVSSADLAALSQQLEKEAADAKQAKDNKDVEKLPER